LITANGVTPERYLDVMRKGVEWEKRITLVIFPLFGNVAIDGGDPKILVFGDDFVQEQGNDFLKVSDGGFGEGAGKGGCDGWLVLFEREGFLKVFPMLVDPSSDAGDFWNLGEQTQQDEEEHSVRGGGNSVFGAGSGQGSNSSSESRKRRTGHDKPPCTEGKKKIKERHVA
jgi:hypothetical protein